MPGKGNRPQLSNWAQKFSEDSDGPWSFVASISMGKLNRVSYKCINRNFNFQIAQTISMAPTAHRTVPVTSLTLRFVTETTVHVTASQVG